MVFSYSLDKQCYFAAMTTVVNGRRRGRPPRSKINDSPSANPDTATSVNKKLRLDAGHDVGTPNLKPASHSDLGSSAGAVPHSITATNTIKMKTTTVTSPTPSTIKTSHFTARSVTSNGAASLPVNRNHLFKLEKTVKTEPKTPGYEENETPAPVNAQALRMQ